LQSVVFVHTLISILWEFIM